jgi:hypothetical protein
MTMMGGRWEGADDSVWLVQILFVVFTCGEWAITSHGRLQVQFGYLWEVGHCFAWQVTSPVWGVRQ